MSFRRPLGGAFFVFVILAMIENSRMPVDDPRKEKAGDEDEDETLVEQLEESAVELEAEHPTLAAAINTAINILSNAGL